MGRWVADMSCWREGDPARRALDKWTIDMDLMSVRWTYYSNRLDSHNRHGSVCFDPEGQLEEVYCVPLVSDFYDYDGFVEGSISRWFDCGFGESKLRFLFVEVLADAEAWEDLPCRG